jgi:hypothetical protein
LGLAGHSGREFNPVSERRASFGTLQPDIHAGKGGFGGFGSFNLI